MKDERTYLLHAIEAIDAIVSYTVDGREAFYADGKTRDAVIRNIEIIGQAVKGVSDATRALEPDIPWRQIAGMRDKLIHEYFGVDLALVWDVVERDLPGVRPRLEKLSKRLASEASSEAEPAS
ncbi:MAG: HepT-like ribonuclease domain-containing protein [Solirubrobacteraceae bacterium]